jgi:tRNA 2-thiocytidine biosynthesis protein TtcA
MDVKEIEHALITRYRTKLLTPFIRALKTYELLGPGDVVGVCVSGGKDSLVMAKLFQELQRHSDFPIALKFLVMDPGFSESNLNKLKENAQILGIPIIIRESDIFRVAENHGGERPCYLCARMRRGFLYKFAQSEGCNKIALAHHFNDVVETIMLSILFTGNFQTMPPKLKSTNHPGMELIRPLYLIKEKDISNFIRYCGIQAMNCGCRVASQELPSKRREIKELISALKKQYSNVDQNIFQSSNNVNVNAILGWRFKEKQFTFLDFYDNTDEND